MQKTKTSSDPCAARSMNILLFVSTAGVSCLSERIARPGVLHYCCSPSHDYSLPLIHPSLFPSFIRLSYCKATTTVTGPYCVSCFYHRKTRAPSIPVRLPWSRLACRVRVYSNTCVSLFSTPCSVPLARSTPSSASLSTLTWMQPCVCHQRPQSLPPAPRLFLQTQLLFRSCCCRDLSLVLRFASSEHNPHLRLC